MEYFDQFLNYVCVKLKSKRINSFQIKMKMVKFLLNPFRCWWIFNLFISIFLVLHWTPYKFKFETFVKRFIFSLYFSSCERKILTINLNFCLILTFVTIFLLFRAIFESIKTYRSDQIDQHQWKVERNIDNWIDKLNPKC